MSSRAARLLATSLILAVVATASGGTESVEEFVRRHWRGPLAPQGTAPASFSPLEASLRPESCGTCHPAQYADWRTSWHAAATGPGVMGQLVEMFESDPTSYPMTPGPVAAIQELDIPPGERSPLHAVVAYYPVCGTLEPWSVKVPVLVLMGVNDKMALPAACQQLFARLPPGTPLETWVTCVATSASGRHDAMAHSRAPGPRRRFRTAA